MVVDEFTRLQRERVYDEELEGAQNYMVGHFPLTIEVPDAIATQVLNQLFYELPVEDLPRYRERVLRVTPGRDPARRALVHQAGAAVDRARRRRRQVRQRSQGRRLRHLRAHSDRAARSAVGRFPEAHGAPADPSDPPHAVVRRAVRRSVRRRAGRRAAPPRAGHRRVRPRRRAVPRPPAAGWSPISTACRSPASPRRSACCRARSRRMQRLVQARARRNSRTRSSSSTIPTSTSG